MRVAVAGAGLAGLTAALALAQRGLSVDIYERAPRLEDIGAGIQLSPNAMAVLDRLGVRAELAPALVLPEAIEIGEASSGALLTRIALGDEALARYGAPYGLIHRADLHSALAEAAGRDGRIRLRLDARINAMRETGDSIEFRAGGRDVSADVLVAADGVHSEIRTALFPHSVPRRLAKTAWRTTLPASCVPKRFRRNVTSLWLGRGFHLVHYPVRAGAAVNFVFIGRAGATDGPPIGSLGAPLRPLVGEVAQWLEWPLLVVDALPAWTHGRIVLIGDAAHAMAPTAAQGGAQAIEDAWTLGAILAECSDAPNSALARFEAARRPRVERISKMSLRNLAIYDLAGLAAVARNMAISRIPPRRHLAALDWIYGWKPDSQP